MLLFMDTWAWVSLANEKDPHARENSVLAADAFAEAGLYTTNFVLSEAISLAYRRFGGYRGEIVLDNLMDLLKLPEAHLEEITPQRLKAAIDLRRQHRDKPEITMTDLTSMVVMQELGIRDIMTNDQNFRRIGLGFRIVP